MTLVVFYRGAETTCGRRRVAVASYAYERLPGSGSEVDAKTILEIVLEHEYFDVVRRTARSENVSLVPYRIRLGCDISLGDKCAALPAPPQSVGATFTVNETPWRPFFAVAIAALNCVRTVWICAAFA